MNPTKQTYQIIAGAVERPVYGARRTARTATRTTVERNARTLVAMTTTGETAKDRAHALWFTDLRRGRLSIYGGLLRFIDHLAHRGVPMDVALQIPAWIESYVRDAYGDTPSGQYANQDRAA